MRRVLEDARQAIERAGGEPRTIDQLAAYRATGQQLLEALQDNLKDGTAPATIEAAYARLSKLDDEAGGSRCRQVAILVKAVGQQLRDIYDPDEPWGAGARILS